MSDLTHVIATIIVISLVYATSRAAEDLGLPTIPAVFFWHLSQYLRRKFCRQQPDHEDNHAMPRRICSLFTSIPFINTFPSTRP